MLPAPKTEILGWEALMFTLMPAQPLFSRRFAQAKPSTPATSRGTIPGIVPIFVHPMARPKRGVAAEKSVI
ncbi:hypothetical protein GCM10007937_29520 [Mesorhizobium albiziae]|nr:hypothetical protein GCM10007937_29520 [Mesorhizobium albiziae]